LGGAKMDIILDKKSGVPLYIQVKKQIMDLVKEGALKVGTKMPTERELSQELGVSRNTISAAYKELELNGVLKSLQGKGTFVAEEVISWKSQDSQKKIIKFVDLALEEAVEIGIEADDFLEIVTQRVKEKKELMDKITSAFVECNIEQARMFSNQLTKITNMNAIPLTVGELEDMSEETIDKLQKCQVIIATFNHVNEVSNLLKDWNKEILGISINPNLESIVKIARHPSSTRFSFICLSQEFIFKIKYALEKAGLEDFNIDYFNDTDEENLKKLIDNSDVLIVTPGRYKDVVKLNHENKEIIEFSYILDESSVKALKSRIIEIKYQKK
jgi:DNA-binding transcriptional regulator YhcF (GntR family)